MCCATHQRKKLDHLCRYITRPAIANERLALNRAGQVALTLKAPYREGTTHIVMSPLELMQRLAAFVPRPRLHLIRFPSRARAQRQLPPVPGRVPVCLTAHEPGSTVPPEEKGRLKSLFAWIFWPGTYANP